MTVENAALSTAEGRLDDAADVTITLTRDALGALILGGPGAAARKFLTRQIKLRGKRRKVGELLSLFVEPHLGFNVVAPCGACRGRKDQASQVNQASDRSALGSMCTRSATSAKVPSAETSAEAPASIAAAARTESKAPIRSNDSSTPKPR